MTSTLIRKRTSIALVSVLALAIMGLPSAVGAAAGDHDPSFGTGGKVVTDLGGSDFGEALALQPNGTLVVGGAAGDPGDFGLASPSMKEFDQLWPAARLARHLRPSRRLVKLPLGSAAPRVPIYFIELTSAVPTGSRRGSAISAYVTSSSRHA